MKQYHSPQFFTGTSAERGALTPHGLPIGARFYETDTQHIYRWINNEWVETAGGSGVSDHGQLTGLDGDDHEQYHNNGRAATWHGALSGAHVTGGDSHTHPVYALDADLDTHTGLTTLAHGGVVPSTALSGLTKITVGTSQPSNPSVGDLWIAT